MPRRSQILKSRAKRTGADISLDESQRKKQKTNEEDEWESAPDTSTELKSTQRAAKKIGYDSMEVHTARTKRDIRHSMLAAFNGNAVPVSDLTELKVYPSVKVAAPQAIHVSNDEVPFLDICHKRTKERMSHRRLLKVARTRYLNLTQRERNIRKVAKEQTYPITLFDLAERVHSEPDPYFHGSYDYYYTGGNLCVLPYNEHAGMRVLHVSNSNLQCLNLGVIDAKDDILSIKPLHSQISADKTTEVFELGWLRSPHQQQSEVFAIRQQHSLTLYNIQPSHPPRIKPITQFKSTPTPFISFAQSTTNNEMLMVTSMTQHLRLYDLRTNKLQNFKFDEDVIRDQPNSWNMIRPWQGQTYLYANENKFCFADTRTSVNNWHLQELHYEQCEVNSSIAKSIYDNLFYVATSHNMYCLDARNMKRHNTICCWTHQLEYGPAFIDTLPRDNSEIIALSSQLANDLCVCELTCKQDGDSGVQYNSPILPFQPTTLQEAYDHARNAGICLHPNADIKRRIRQCITGLKFAVINESDEALLLTSNSIGDVYAAKISTRTEQVDERVNAKSDEQMLRYSKSVHTNVEPILKHTNVVDLSAMRRILLCTNLNSPNENSDIEVKDEYDKTKSTIKYSFGRWQKSIQTLHSYKDALVPNLLEIWNVDVEKEYIDIKNSKNIIKEQPDSKSMVKNWLQSSAVGSIPPMVSVPMCSFQNDMDLILTSTQQSDNGNSNSIVEQITTVASTTTAKYESSSKSTMLDYFPKQTHLATAKKASESTMLDDFSMLPQSTQISDMSMNGTILNTTTESTVIQTQKKKKKKLYIKGF